MSFGKLRDSFILLQKGYVLFFDGLYCMYNDSSNGVSVSHGKESMNHAMGYVKGRLDYPPIV